MQLEEIARLYELLADSVEKEAKRRALARACGPIPRPSRVKRGGKSVTMPPSSAAKVAPYRAVRDSGIGKAELEEAKATSPELYRAMAKC